MKIHNMKRLTTTTTTTTTTDKNRPINFCQDVSMGSSSLCEGFLWLSLISVGMVIASTSERQAVNWEIARADRGGLPCQISGVNSGHRVNYTARDSSVDAGE